VIKYFLGSFLLLSMSIFGQSRPAKSKQKTLVFIGGFGHTKMGLKKTFKDFQKRYPKQLKEYEVLYFTHNTSLKKIKRRLHRKKLKNLTIAGYSMGANLALRLSFELASNQIQKVAFVDPWFTCSNWADKEEKANSEFKNKIENLPYQSLLLYGSDFVLKNNKGLSKIAGPFGTKQCKDCYVYLSKKWIKNGKVYISGSGHKYFPELYIKQFLNHKV